MKSYTIAGTGRDTITTVFYDPSANELAVDYNNSGDGTVLQGSAGYGTPDCIINNNLFSNAEHTKLLNNSTVRKTVVEQITAATGVIPRNSFMETQSIDTPVQEYTTNSRGWIMGLDNHRINIYADGDAVLYAGGHVVDECWETLYNENGDEIGTVWRLGNSGRKLYALYDGNYTVSTSGTVKIEYMNDGYYDKAVQYETEELNAIYFISNHCDM